MLGDINIEIERKEIKNLHLSVYPPNGIVKIAAPSSMKMDTIRVFAISKLRWIKCQQQKILSQEREPPRHYIDRETHYVWGRRYLLKVIETNRAPKIQLKHRQIIFYARVNATIEKKQAIMESWQREQLKKALNTLIDKWQPIMGVKVHQVFIQKMKTRWGSCNTGSASLRLNSELAKKPKSCLEYVLVHEMAHLIEPTHNNHFIALMDKYMPDWRFLRDLLNKAPLGC